jgi:hypothetical protein
MKCFSKRNVFLFAIWKSRDPTRIQDCKNKQDQRAKSKEQRQKTKEQRAKNKDKRTKTKEQRQRTLYLRTFQMEYPTSHLSGPIKPFKLQTSTFQTSTFNLQTFKLFFFALITKRESDILSNNKNSFSRITDI